MYHILLAGDENYLKFLAVCMYSIIINTDKTKTIMDFNDFNQEIHGKGYIQANDVVFGDRHEEKYYFHVLTDKISEHNREKVKKMELELNKIFSCEILIHVILPTEFIGLKMWRNSYIPYYRLLINRILPKNLQKVLYLDGSDTFINDDIRELFALDLKDCFSAVVQDTGESPFVGEAVKNSEEEFKNFYFNSGVMLINLSEWRNHDIEEKSLNYIKSNELSLPDQDTLNYLFNKKIILLPYTWNMMINKDNPPKDPIQHPKITHYAFKPWKSSPHRPFWVSNQGGYYYPMIDVWWDIASKTPVFNEDIKTYSQSNSYKKILARQAKLERIFNNGPSLEYALYKFNKKFLPYYKKVEKCFKFLRKQFRDYLLKKTIKIQSK